MADTGAAILHMHEDALTGQLSVGENLQSSVVHMSWRTC